MMAANKTAIIKPLNPKDERVTRQVPQVEQGLFMLPEHMI
jgi:hypothetical protein